MSFKVNLSRYKRFFSVPCALVDRYIKLADGSALKLILYLMSSEDNPDEKNIAEAIGLTQNELEEAVMFWTDLGVIAAQDMPSEQAKDLSAEPSRTAGQPSPAKIIHTRYQPKDIAQMLKTDPGLKDLFSEAESTIGRILKHADHESLISLRDYYGFTEQSIVLILGYCVELDKTSARYYETVAKSLFEKGITEFHQIEDEFVKMREKHGFEAKVKSNFGLDIKLTPKQSEYICSWRDMGFGLDMISLARERCADSTNKLSFPYIDKILKSWHEKGYFTPEAAESDIKPKQVKGESSFDLDEFDMFTLGTGKEKK